VSQPTNQPPQQPWPGFAGQPDGSNDPMFGEVYRPGGQDRSSQGSGGQGAGGPSFSPPAFSPPGAFGGSEMYPSPRPGEPPSNWSGDGSGGPSRTTWIAALVGAALTAGVIVGGARILGVGSPSGAAAAPAQTTSSPSSSSAGTTSSAGSDPSASSSSSAAVSTSSTNGPWSWNVTGYLQDPSAQGYDFGKIVAITREGKDAVVTLDRAYLLSGDTARKYGKKHKIKGIPNDYIIVDDVKTTRTFTVVADAELFGAYVLGDHTNIQTQSLTMDLFVSRTQQALNANQALWVWTRHRDNRVNRWVGPINYVAEQYLP
jgi:hypothetical protein